MNGPDGPEERTADLEETAELHYDELDRTMRIEEEQVDESLLELAEARMQSFWLERVMG